MGFGGGGVGSKATKHVDSNYNKCFGRSGFVEESEEEHLGNPLSRRKFGGRTVKQLIVVKRLYSIM